MKRPLHLPKVPVSYLLLSLAGASLLPSTGFGQEPRAGIYPKESPVVVGVPIKEENTPLLVVFDAEGPVTVKWFSGEMPDTYAHSDPLPEGNRLIREQTQTYASTIEGKVYWYFRLNGATLESTDPLWANVKAQDFEANLTYEGEIVEQFTDPGIESVTFTASAKKYYPGTTFTGKLGADPFISVVSLSTFTTLFYAGESGDTSRLLYSTNSSFGAPYSSHRTVFLNRITLTETMKIWARVSCSVNTIDTGSVEFVVIDPADLNFVDWKSTVTGFDSGTKVVLKPELNEVVHGTTAAWYFGETGDTSQPAGPNYLGMTNYYELTVPDDPVSLWVRLTMGDFTLDSPTVTVIPRLSEPPSILDQPDDILQVPGRDYPEVSTYFSAVGGNLQFQVFAGLPGDLSSPLEHSQLPFTEGNNFILQFEPEDTASFHVVVSNSLGTTSSRAVTIRDFTFEDLSIRNYPSIVRLRESDLRQNEITQGKIEIFWVDFTGFAEKGELWRITPEGPELAFSTAGLFYSRLYSCAVLGAEGPNDQEVLAPLPSGEYFIRLWLGNEFVDTGTIHFINETADTLIQAPPAMVAPLRLAGEFTDGGVFNARLAVNRKLRSDSLQVFAGQLGDTSEPVSFNTNFRDYVAIYGAEEELGDPVFNLSWTPIGADSYWFRAETYDGELVQTVLRTPVGINAGAVMDSIVLPPGAGIIRIPPLPPSPVDPDWRQDGNASDGIKVELPLELIDLLTLNSDISIWGTRSELLGNFSIGVDDELPPQIETVPAVAAVAPDGRVIWTSSVNGETTRTSVYWREDEGDWQLLNEYCETVSGGFRPSDSADWIKTVYHMDDLSNSAGYSLRRIPQDAWDNLLTEYAYEDTLLTSRMGSLFGARHYPWLEHSELGWLYLIPVGDNLVVWADIAGQGFGWNWIIPDQFPYIYNCHLRSWLYYQPNSRGLYFDLKKEEWIDARL